MPIAGSEAKIAVHVYPNATNNAVVGYVGGVLQMRVSAPPEKGKANEELVSFLSKVLGVSKSNISIIRGHATRNKLIAISGLGQDEVMRRLLPH
ncbi:DUF167 domain-containing protein [Chloroflexota bacterium]